MCIQYTQPRKKVQEYLTEKMKRGILNYISVEEG